MNLEPLKDKCLINREKNAKVYHFHDKKDDILFSNVALYQHNDVKSAVEWLRSMICHCKKKDCRHKIMIDEAFPDIKKIKVNENEE